jgi:hypothetical protein
MSVLSDQDIIRELGRGILFHPLKPSVTSQPLKGSIRAGDLCLTASENAYAIGLQQRLPIQTEANPDNPSEQLKYFEIPPRETALVWTDESVWLSNEFRGPLYSVVEQAADGLGHIGTRVNPFWAAVLCIPLHNLSDGNLRIYVRNLKKPIAYLAIEKLSSRSSITPNSDNPARLDLIAGKPNSQEISDYYNKTEHLWMRGDYNKLRELMIASDEYKKLKKGVKDTLLGFLGSDEEIRWSAGNTIATWLAVIISLIALFKPSSSSNLNPTKAPTPQSQVNQNITVITRSNK